MTDRERFQRVKRIFDVVAELPYAERSARLTTLCGADVDLRSRVAAMLAAEAEGTGSLEPTVFGGAVFAEVMGAEDAAVAPTLVMGAEDAAAKPTLAGTRIAHYEIEERIGEGGMGEVYSAFDSTLRRRVAIKVVHRNQPMDDAVRARFLREARMLSSLDHPHICRIHDYVSDGGTDFLVLELIGGRSLRTALAEGLSASRKMTVAEQIAGALAVAHAGGIVHRDLKLLNVMLTVEDEVKILDFGLARSVESDEELPLPGEAKELSASPVSNVEGAQFRTAFGMMTGTPSAMSPEQLLGQAATPASDMYSFGLLAQELFTGASAYDPQLDLGDLVRAAKRGITRPVEGLEKDLAALIDALKASRPGDRPTAAAIVERLRWIRDKPRRRLRFAVVSGLVLLALLAGLKYTLDLRRERTVANQRRGQAEDLIGFMLGDLRSRLEPIGRLEVLDEVGDQALDYFAAVPEEELSDDELFRRAQALTQIGEVRMVQGSLGNAQEAYAEALGLSADLARRQPANQRYQAGLGAAHFWVGHVRWLREDVTGALASWQSYLEIAEELVRADPDNLEWKMELSYAHNNLGTALKAQGETERALAEFRESLGLKEQAVKGDPTNVVWLRELADSRSWLGDALMDLGDLTGALAEHGRHQALLLELLSANPSHAELIKRTADSYDKLGLAQQLTGRLEEAGQSFARFEKLMRQLVALDGTNTLWRRGLAAAQRHAGAVLTLAGEPAAALAKLKPACAANRELQALDTANRDLVLELADCLVTRSRAALEAGDFVLAEALARDAAGRVRRDPAEGSESDESTGARTVALRARAALLLGDALQATARPREAGVAYSRGLAELEPLAARTERLRTQSLYAQLLAKVGREDEAQPIFDRLETAGYRLPTTR